MFESRNQRNFSSAPQSVTALIATVLEPAITVLVYALALYWHHEPMGRADLTLCFLVVALTWPGINRFRDRLSSAAVGILGSWLTLLAILAGFGYGTRSLDLFDRDVLMLWVLATPVLQLLAVRLGHRVLRRESADTRNWRNAVVTGAGSLGVKMARAIGSRPVQGINFVGYFFKPKRNGLDGEVIVAYNSRSMTTTDNGMVAKPAIRGDARITRFGAFTRKTWTRPRREQPHTTTSLRTFPALRLPLVATRVSLLASATVAETNPCYIGCGHRRHDLCPPHPEQRSHRDIAEDQQPTEGCDNTAALALGGRWSPTRSAQLGCDLSTTQRSSSSSNASLSVPLHGISLSCYGQFALQ